jgi:hypothetical protein
MVDWDRMPDAAPGGLTASRSRIAAQSCAPPTTAVVEVIVIVLSPMCADLYALL